MLFIKKTEIINLFYNKIKYILFLNNNLIIIKSIFLNIKLKNI